MVCRAIPYEGTEPFIFVSYCHEDKKRIHPLLEQMVRDSYRIWYDENMHAGEDSADNIENHLEDCAVVIAFISENYSLSHACRSELTYALKCRKKVISVLIEDFSLSKGFRTQLNHFGCLKQSDFPNENAMLSGIYADPVCKDCNAPAGSLSLRNIVVYVTPKPIKDGKKQLRKKEAQIKPDDQSSADTDNSSSDTEQKRSDHLQPVDQAELQTVIQNDKIGKTVFLSDFDDEEDEPICVVSKNIAILIQLSTKRAYILRTSQTKIGRSPIKCDVVIENNDSISRYHADLLQQNDFFFLRDANSGNGSFVNGTKLESGAQKILDNPAVFRLSDETFILITGLLANKLYKEKEVSFLMNSTSTAVRIMDTDTLLLNRNNAWSDGTLSDRKVHRAAHAQLRKGSDGIYLFDRSPEGGNGTYLNNTKLTRAESHVLVSGDSIQLGDTTLAFVSVEI